MTAQTGDESPLVTAVMATYNRVDLVSQSLDSILAQTYPNIEIIVVDDGSSDGSAEMIREKYGDRVTCITQENGGPSKARNTAVREARGQYIAFHDDDDLWLPDKISAQVKALERDREAGMCYCMCLSATAEGEDTGKPHGYSHQGRSGDCFGLFLKRNVVMLPSVLVRKTVLDEVGVFDEDLRYGEDTDLFLRITARYPAIYIGQPQVLVRAHGGKLSSGRHTSTRGQRSRIITMGKLLANLPADRTMFRSAIAHRLVKAHIQIVRRELEELDWDALGERLLDVYWETAHTPAQSAVAQWTASLLREWGALHPGESRERLSEESLVPLAEKLAMGAEGGRAAPRAARLYAALGLDSLRHGRPGRALSWLWRGAWRNLPASTAHCLWAPLHKLRGEG